MNFKHLAVAAVVGSSPLMTSTATAQLSGNVEVVSQYIFRGIEESTDAAVQGGFDYEAESGFYVGTWASTIDSLADGTGFTRGNAETNLYLGFATDLFDIGALYYYYPGQEKAGNKTIDTFEIYGAVSFGFLDLSAWIAPGNYFGTDDDAYGFGAGISLPLSDKLSFDAFVGYNDVKVKGDDNFDYIDYSLGVSAELDGGFGMSFAIAGNDLDDDDKPKVVVGFSYAFDL